MPDVCARTRIKYTHAWHLIRSLIEISKLPSHDGDSRVRLAYAHIRQRFEASASVTFLVFAKGLR